MITATAPGKAVLCGEYAVLKGAPAIATAINRRSRVTIAESPGDKHSITTPGYLEGSWHFHASKNGGVEWQERLPDSSTFALVEEIWKSFDTTDWPALAITVDSKEFRDAATGLKFGLGSSAAVAVALTAALQNFDSVDSDIGKLAGNAHDRFQGGRGSGVDIAASLHGGLIEYRRDSVATRQLRWPANLYYQFLWSGQTAATPEKLAKLGEGRANDNSTAMLNDRAEAVASAWSTGDCQQILDSFPAYIDALRQFSVDHELGIFDAGHEELVQSAADTRLVYKPCGAGGGDIGVILTEDKDAMREFCKQAAQQGFQVLDITAGEQGVVVSDRRR